MARFWGFRLYIFFISSIIGQKYRRISELLLMMAIFGVILLWMLATWVTS
jgi:hypothetical protein